VTDARVVPARVRYDVFAEPESGTLGEGTLLDQVAAVVHGAGDRLAVVDESRRVNYRELWESAAHLAAYLRKAGCADGDRVCVDLPNGVGWVEAVLGVLLAGCVAVPLDQRATTQYRDFVRTNSGAQMTLDAAGPAEPGSESEPGGRYRHHPELDEVALLLYTSGTTGIPKGVMLSHANLASYQRITAAYLGRRPGGEPFRNLIAIPLSHSAGCNTQLLPTLALGGTAVIAPGSGPGSVLPMLVAWRPDLMFAVPVVYRRLLDATVADRSPLRSLRDVHFGAASAPQTLVRDLRSALPGARLGNAFGMTELSNVGLFLPDEFLESSAGSIGFPVPGVECEIRDADESGRGELYLRGPNMSVGYWERAELTDAVFGTGWVRSGDVAEVGADGAVYLFDRADDVINRGGEKIYSTSIEEALLELPGVTEAAVVGRPDPEMGSRVAALIVGHESYDTARLRTALAGRLPPHAVPEDVISQTEHLPRGSSGKVLKREVLARFADPDAAAPPNGAETP
jgi:long-chain acyl-CoA synthetase